MSEKAYILNIYNTMTGEFDRPCAGAWPAQKSW